MMYLFCQTLQAFMFESSFSMALTKWGDQTCQKVDATYYECWQPLKKRMKLSDGASNDMSWLNETAWLPERMQPERMQPWMNTAWMGVWWFTNWAIAAVVFNTQGDQERLRSIIVLNIVKHVEIIIVFTKLQDSGASSEFKVTLKI